MSKTPEDKAGGDGQPEVEKKTSNGNGKEKSGLVIDVVLPEKKSDDEPELGKKH